MLFAILPREFNPPPLVLAVTCEARGVGIVEMLLSAGAHIDCVDEKRADCLLCCCSPPK
jgi:hypothetical protein